MKINDPIVRDVRNAREKLFSEYGDDLNKLLDYYHDQEKLDQGRLVKNIKENDSGKSNPGAT